MNTRAALWLVPLAVLLSGCDECAGTGSCGNLPQLSYSGQTIEHATGRIIPGTRVAFVRDSGVGTAQDSAFAISDAEGFFAFRMDAFGDGIVHGHLVITPPAPFAGYETPSLSLSTSRTRGDGAFIGRVTVHPYFLLVGHVRDRKTLVPQGDATVDVRLNFGVSQDASTFVTDIGGQFAWYPTVPPASSVKATFEITAPGYPRTFVITRTLDLSFRDGEMSFQILPLGFGFPQVGNIIRRGFGLFEAGVTAEMRRLSGIATEPNAAALPLSVIGEFPIPLDALEPGTVVVELKITPPAPIPVEVDTLVLATSDDALATRLGFFGYGAHAYLSAPVRFADDGASVPAGTVVTFKRVSGLPLLWSTPADGDARLVNDSGRVLYGAPTPDSGVIVYDAVVRLAAPLMWDTVRAMAVPARYENDPVDIEPILVRRRARP